MTYSQVLANNCEPGPEYSFSGGIKKLFRGKTEGSPSSPYTFTRAGGGLRFLRPHRAGNPGVEHAGGIIHRRSHRIYASHVHGDLSRYRNWPGRG